MKKVLLFLFLALLTTSVNAVASDDLSADVAKILKMDLSHEERTDSAFTRVCEYNSGNLGRESFITCEKVLKESIIPYAERHDVSPVLKARIYDEFAQFMIRQGRDRVDEARECRDKALAYAREAGDWYWIGRVIDHQATTEINIGDSTKGFSLSEEAIAAYKKSPHDTDKFIIRLHYLQAIVYLQLTDMEGLAKVIEAMRKFADEARAENEPYILYNLYSVCEAYYGTLAEASKGKERKAYLDSLNRYSLRSIQIIEASPDIWHTTSVNQSWNYYNRAVMFLNTDEIYNMDSVLYYCDKALNVDHHGKTDPIQEVRISVASLIAEGWMKQGNYAKAKEILLSTLKELDEAKVINNLIIDKAELYKNLISIARESGNYKDAYEYAEALSKVEKERYSEERTKAIKELEIKYETQETRLALAESEASRASTLIWLFAATGLLLLAVVIFVIYATRQKRRRLQREMEFANLRADIGRQLTRQYVEGLENERERMARELHDGVCNDLLAIRMNINSGKPIENTAALIDNCREAVRRISHELMPPEFAYATLDEVVRFYIAKQAEANEGKIAFVYDSSAEGTPWDAVPDAVCLEVYRIIQEAVGNAVKHSGATDISVALHLTAQSLDAVISDNGTYKSAGKKGLGLESIRRRANSINGTVTVDTNNTGTKVTLRCPSEN